MGFHHRMVRVLETAGSLLPPEVAVTAGHGLHQGQGPCADTPSRVGLDLSVVVEDLNPVLRGWGAYFRHGNSSAKFGAIDSYVHERMAMLASRKHGLPGATGPTASLRAG